MELKGNVVLISKEPIEVKESTSMTDEKCGMGKRYRDSFSFTVNTTVSRKILRWMTKGDREHSRFLKQLVAL